MPRRSGGVGGAREARPWAGDLAKTQDRRHRTERFNRYLEAEEAVLAGLVARLRRGAEALEIGCGRGRIVQAIVDADRDKRVAGIVGVDFAESLVRQAGARFREDGRVEIIRKDATDLPAGWAGRFDLAVIAFNTLGVVAPVSSASAVLSQALRCSSRYVFFTVFASSAREAQLEQYEMLGWEPREEGDLVRFGIAEGKFSRRFALDDILDLVKGRIGVRGFSVEVIAEIAWSVIVEKGPVPGELVRFAGARQ